MLEANMSASLSVPQGWPAEREAIYAAGRQARWADKRRSLFWRGGETHAQRRVYAEAFSSGRVKLRPGVDADVVLCGAHCSLEQGVRRRSARANAPASAMAASRTWSRSRSPTLSLALAPTLSCQFGWAGAP